jgi:glycine/D-amino acid oxidase-like deaminating enzyme
VTSKFIQATELPPTAEVIVIGGGLAGTAALWAIERAAPGTQTVLLEQSQQLAAGSSLASLENFRTCWPTMCLMKMMTRSVDVLLNADTYLGEGVRASLGIKQQGYLYVGFTEGHAAGLKRDVEHLHRIGLGHVEYLDAAEVAYRYPWLGGHVRAAKYDPLAGWLDSNALAYRYVQNAPTTKIALGVSDIRIRVERGHAVGVSTGHGEIDAPNVIIAAGAGARQVGRTAGIEIPIVLRPRQSFTTGGRHDGFPDDAPCVISAAPFPHVRPEARTGAIFGWEYRWQTPLNGRKVGELIDPVWPVEQFRDPRFPSLTLALLARQFGHREGEGFASPGYLRGISHRAGYYVYRDNAYITAADGSRRPYESQRAIIDAWPGIDGLFLSVAHVGHGIMASPAAGEIIASKVLRRPLPDPAFADFGLDVPYVEHDAGGLGLAGE